MTMDLWYDLAICERPDLDVDVVDPDELETAAEQRAPSVPASGSVAVDFF
jgi:hypothetical protein